MGSTLRALAAGLAAGVALSLARAPLGIDLAQAPALSARESLGWRGLALAVLALAIGRYGGDRPRFGTLAAGAAAGFALHGLVLANAVSVSSRLQLAGVLALALFALRLVREPRPASDAEREPPIHRSERFGLLIAGWGTATALEPLARWLRLLSGATPADESVFGAVFLALLAIGAGAFGPLLPRGQRGAAAGVLIALAALACVESLRTLGSFASRERLDAFLKQAPWSLDLSVIGRLDGDLLLGARALLLPAFALGAASFAASRGSRLAWILFGAAIGHFLMPGLLAEIAELEPGRAAATLVASGAALAGVGGAIASFSASATPKRGRIVGTVLGCAGAVAALSSMRAVGVPLSPWERLQVAPTLVRHAPVGLLTIEPTMDFGHVATLDRHWLTPAPSGEASDEQRLRLAWGRVDSAALQ